MAMDITASRLAGVATIAYSNTTGPDPDRPEEELRNWSSLIGIITAIVGNVLIALALNVQRYAHIRLHRERAIIKERAGLAEPGPSPSQYNASHYGALNNGPAAEQGPGTGFFDGADESWGRNGRRSLEGLGSPDSAADDDDGLPESPSYLRSPYWWLGQVLISLGEMGNFLAYGFAPASIVSPLGVVALISNCIIAPMLFNETFRQRDFWGVAIAVGGVVTVVLSANQQETKLEPHDVWDAITTLEFEIYLAVTGILIVSFMWISSTCPRRTILVDLGLVGLFGMFDRAFWLVPAPDSHWTTHLTNLCRWLHGTGHKGCLIHAVVYALASLYNARNLRPHLHPPCHGHHADPLRKQGATAVRLDGGDTHPVRHVHPVRHHRERGPVPRL